MAERGPEFSTEEIERALTALALVGGNSRRARELLQEDDQLQRVPSEQVLRLWRSTSHPERYKAILEARAPEIEQAAIHDYRAIVAATNRAHLELVERTADQIDSLDGKEAAAAAKNLAIAGGVAADKLLVFTDRPNIIHSKPDPDHLVEQLQQAFGIKPPTVIDATATDESNPEVALLAENGSSNARELAS